MFGPIALVLGQEEGLQLYGFDGVEQGITDEGPALVLVTNQDESGLSLIPEQANAAGESGLGPTLRDRGERRDRYREAWEWSPGALAARASPSLEP